MSAIKCQSKNPSQCRFHAPNAGAKTLAVLEETQKRFNMLEKRVENVNKATEQDYINLQEAKWDLDKAEDDYYGTNEGLQSLYKKKSELVEGSDEYYDLEMRIRLSEAQVRENEDKLQRDEKFGGSLVPHVQSTYKIPGATISGDDLWPTTTGEKYNPSFSTRQIATNLSADFRQAQKEGYLPAHLKFKVSPNSAHSRIKVTIIGADESQIWDDSASFPTYTKDGFELKQRVERIFGGYRKSQYDVIEGRTNYTTYWGSVEYETKWEQEKRLQKEEVSRQKRLAK